MKKLIILAFFAISSLTTMAQNLQLHYDFGKGRKMITSTVEMFKADNFGATYFFFDLDFGTEDSNLKSGINQFYGEISRSFKLAKLAFQPRIEYDGGFGRFKIDENNTKGYSINSAYLIGIEKTWHTPDFSKIFTLQLNYKYIEHVENASFQITGVWGINLFNNKLSISGFADFWKEDNANGNYIFISEPQFWYNFNKSFSVGSEIEISSNFANYDGFKICPTVALKWNI